MNKVILLGRLTRDPEVRYGGANNTAVSRFTLAVERRFKRDNEQTADFINCLAFGKKAEFEEKYFRKGTKVCITGRIQTGSYTNKDGQKVYTTDVIVEEQEFAESKASGQQSEPQIQAGASPYGHAHSSSDGFMNILDGIDEGIPFN